MRLPCSHRIGRRPGLRRDSSAAVVRFVESRFDEARTMAEVRKMFGEPRGVAISPMPLRSIFVTLAKAIRRAHETGSTYL